MADAKSVRKSGRVGPGGDEQDRVGGGRQWSISRRSGSSVQPLGARRFTRRYFGH